MLEDGAEWIWDLAADHFYGAAQVLDIWHGAEKLAEAGRAVWGAGERLETWLHAAQEQLVADGYAGVCVALASLTAAGAEPQAYATVASVLNYFAGHQRRLPYAARCRRGQVIGSGLVEGSIKQLVNLQMKRTGARWRVERVGPFVEFIALAESPEWSEYWTPSPPECQNLAAHPRG